MKRCELAVSHEEYTVARKPRQRFGMWVGVVAVLLAQPAPAESAVGRAGTVRDLAATACAICHDIDGSGATALIPGLAGMPSGYLAKQLADFGLGMRQHGNNIPPEVAGLKSAEIESLAAYYSKLKPGAGVVGDMKLAEEGGRVFVDGNETSGLPACDGCHGEYAAGRALVPRLAGQSSEYLVQQLKNFRSGARKNDPNRFMQVVALRMTDQEMKAVAAYLAGLTTKN